ncbi:MAG: polymer-forming cytoskeletal protein [Cellvibrionaceae bacterium]
MGISGSASTTLIAKNTEVVGDIHFSGTLHIEGTLRGNVHVKDGGDAHLDVAEHGCVEGQITVPTVRINGRVVGDVHSSKHVELAAKAEVEGNVHYKLIEMVKGAQVNGSLVYTGENAGKQAKPAVAFDEAKTAAVGSKTTAVSL